MNRLLLATLLAATLLQAAVGQRTARRLKWLERHTARQAAPAEMPPDLCLELQVLTAALSELATVIDDAKAPAGFGRN